MEETIGNPKWSGKRNAGAHNDAARSGEGCAILQRNLGLGFCHPLLSCQDTPPAVSSLSSFSLSILRKANFLTFATRCVSSCSMDNGCLSDRSQRQSHGNRDGFYCRRRSVPNACRLHSAGSTLLYLAFCISRCSRRLVETYEFPRDISPSRGRFPWKTGSLFVR